MTKAADYEKIIKTYMSRLGKKSHKKHPRTKEHYKRMWASSAATRAAKAKNKLSPDK